GATVNTHLFYERRSNRTPTKIEASSASPDPAPGPWSGPSAGNAEVSAFAVHGDPSRHQKPPEENASRERAKVLWVRPSDLPTMLGTTRVGRGIDLQAELVRRARLAPARGARHLRQRVTRTDIARPRPAAQTAASREGLGL